MLPSSMDVSTFFTRLLQSAPKEPEKVRAPDSEYRLFDETWQAIQVGRSLGLSTGNRADTT